MNHKKHPKKAEEKGIDQLVSQLEMGDVEGTILEELVANHPDEASHLYETSTLWNDLGEMKTPEPRPQMSADFYRKLSEYQTENRGSKLTLWQKINNWLGAGKPQLGLALGIGLFLIGFFSGQVFQPNVQQQQIDQLAQELKVIKQSQNFQLNPQQSVTDRMKNIHLVRNMDSPNDKILNALNQALCNDPNINVRLSAIETLLHFADDPAVMEILIKAIPKQSSSLVQLELATVMVELEEKRSAEAWQKLLEKGEVELEVKMQLEESLQKLM